MPELPVNAVIAAVDDTFISVALAEMRYDEGQYRLESAPSIKVFDREPYDKSLVSDDQGDVEQEGIFDCIQEFCEQSGSEISAFGFSCFGNVNAASGVLTHMPNVKFKRTSPKLFDVKGRVREFTSASVEDIFVENDATAAALGEYIWGCGKEGAAFAYVWAGRGANIGLILNNDVWKGNQHPELGHFYPRRHFDDEYPGNCAIHSDCLIGLAGRKTIDDRLEADLSRDRITDIVGYYYAQLCLNTMLASAVQRIAIGGSTVNSGVLPGLILTIRLHFRDLLKFYPNYPELDDLDAFIVPAELGQEASILGMIEITRRRLTLNYIKGA